MTTAADTGFDPTRGRHPVNTGHLVMGLVFAGLVGIWALVVGDVVADDEIRWLLPIPWVAGGAIGLAAATYANMRSRRTASHPSSSGSEPTWSSQDDTETNWSPESDGTDPTEEIR